MSTLNIADKPTLDTVDSDVTYIKNNLPSGSSSPILVIKNDNMEFTGVEFTVSCGDFTDTATMPDADSVEVEVPYTGEYTISYIGGDLPINDQVNIIGTGKTLYIPTIFTIPSFTNATWEQIERVITAYYNDEIDDLSNYWSVGDTKTISLSAMQAPNPNSSYTWLAQDIVITILDFNHTDLATPINGHTKAAITVQTRELLSGTAARTAGTIYIDGLSSKDASFKKWGSPLYMRTYLNNKVYNAFPSAIKSLIKPSTHYRHTTYNGTESEQVTDNLFLPSYPEVFGTASYTYYVTTSPVEGTQFKYYETAANRIKYPNDNGVASSSASSWWTGSALSYYWSTSDGYYWCGVNADGSVSRGAGNSAAGLAPAWAI